MISLNKKVILSTTFVILVSILGLAGCQTTDTDSPGTGGAPAANQVIIYGKVDSTGPYTNNKSILVLPNAKPCKESTVSDDFFSGQLGWGRITRSGTYRAYTAVSTMPSCLTVFVVSYDTPEHSSKLEYDRLLAGPKKLEPADFSSHMRLRSPFDSVRVDFTVHDSTKIKR